MWATIIVYIFLRITCDWRDLKQINSWLRPLRLLQPSETTISRTQSISAVIINNEPAWKSWFPHTFILRLPRESAPLSWLAQTDDDNDEDSFALIGRNLSHFFGCELRNLFGNFWRSLKFEGCSLSKKGPTRREGGIRNFVKSFAPKKIVN